MLSDPNMVNAYMYQTAGTGGQNAAPGQAPPPNTSPPYTNYQPTPSQGYQVRAPSHSCVTKVLQKAKLSHSVRNVK